MNGTSGALTQTAPLGEEVEELWYQYTPLYGQYAPPHLTLEVVQASRCILLALDFVLHPSERDPALLKAEITREPFYWHRAMAYACLRPVPVTSDLDMRPRFWIACGRAYLREGMDMEAGARAVDDVDIQVRSARAAELDVYFQEWEVLLKVAEGRSLFGVGASTKPTWSNSLLEVCQLAYDIVDGRGAREEQIDKLVVIITSWWGIWEAAMRPCDNDWVAPPWNRFRVILPVATCIILLFSTTSTPQPTDVSLPVLYAASAAVHAVHGLDKDIQRMEPCYLVYILQVYKCLYGYQQVTNPSLRRMIANDLGRLESSLNYVKYPGMSGRIQDVRNSAAADPGCDLTPPSKLKESAVLRWFGDYKRLFPDWNPPRSGLLS